MAIRNKILFVLASLIFVYVVCFDLKTAFASENFTHERMKEKLAQQEYDMVETEYREFWKDNYLVCIRVTHSKNDASCANQADYAVGHFSKRWYAD